MTDIILALIDGSAFSRPVLDLATWAATRNHAPVHLLHVLPPKSLPSVDLSGEIGLGARSTLLSQLSALDEQRASLAMLHGRALLDDAAAFLKAAGISRVTLQLRQGDLLESVAGQEAQASLIVIGKRGQSADQARGHLGSNFERIVRAGKLPVLMAPRQMREIWRATIALLILPELRNGRRDRTNIEAARGFPDQRHCRGALPQDDPALQPLSPPPPFSTEPRGQEGHFPAPCGYVGGARGRRHPAARARREKSRRRILLKAGPVAGRELWPNLGDAA